MSDDQPRGITCPTCGCQHCPQDPTRVERTIALGANRCILRVRVCRHCGRRFTTNERVSATPSTFQENRDLDD